MIDLDEGVRMMNNVAGDPGAVRISARVGVIFDDVTPDLTLPKFRLLEGGVVSGCGSFCDRE
jgi:hypothetical protein